MGITRTFIYGASGHGSVIRDILEATGTAVTGFIDDNPDKKVFSGLPVYSYEEIDPVNDILIIGIGINKIREKIASKVKTKIINAIHPSAVVSPRAIIGQGIAVMPMSVIQPGTTIGDHSIVNTAAKIDHDCSIGKFVHISPGATLCGNVTVGDYSWIGAGATIIQGITIGTNVIVGAGSVIIRDIPDNVTVVGNPGKVYKSAD